MIDKLKRKFILLATVSMLLLMTVLVLIMNLVNYSAVVSESDTVLEVLSQTNAPFFSGQLPLNEPPRKMEDFMPHGMSPEVPYESRFFVVMLSPDGEILESDLSRIISVDESSAKEYITQALHSRQNRGFIGQFRYSKNSDSNGIQLLFLDCGRKLDSFLRFLWTSIGVGLFGCIVVFVAFLLAAGKIVKPIAESYEKQKRFISDAGHEIKTPLTIINANVDLLECDGEKEELNDIRQQTTRLTKLTNDLIFLSKMEEAEHSIQKIELPISDIVSETANSFHALALSRNLGFTTRILPNITANGSPNAIRQLVSILLENAIKYSADGGVVTLDLSVSKKAAILSVFNTTEEKIHEEELPYVFERFYRTDASRNSETGGHGIGLSIAKAIVEAHDGTITATTKNGFDFCITVSLPFV